MTVGEITIASVTLLASVVALSIGIMNAVQTARLRKKEYTAGLLDELRKWALDLWNSQVPRNLAVTERIELAKLGPLGEKARVALEKGEVSLRRAPVLAEGAYVRELAEKVFKRELGDVFESIDTEVTAVGYLTNMDAGVPYTAKPIDPHIVTTIKKD